MMDIKQLKYLIEVANTKNLSHAARNLYVTQPTLSLAMKKLEEEFQVALFNQETNNYMLTQAGQYLYTKGSDLVQNFDEMMAEMDNMSRTHERPLRVGLTILFVIQFMDEISHFIVHHKVDLSIIQDGSKQIQHLVAKGELDIGLVSFPNMYSETLVIDPLAKEKGYHVAVVMPKDHRLASRDSVTFEDLKNERFVTLNNHFVLGELLQKRSRDFKFTPNITLEHEDLQVLLYGVNQLDSICLLPHEYRQINDRDDVVWIDLDDKYASFDIGIATRRDQLRTDVLNDFMTMIKQAH